MDPSFFQHILQKHQNIDSIPPNEVVAGWAIDLIRLLFPQQAKTDFEHIDQIKNKFQELEDRLLHILKNTKACDGCNNPDTVHTFFRDLPKIYALLNKDAEAIVDGDPAAIDNFEVIRTYPGFYAICFYRIAHKLLQLKVPLLPRVLTEYAHSRTGIDIHPGATIGEYFFIDHGTGIVIGETTHIGNHVKLYQGVNLGALSVDKAMKSTKRHPTVEDRVIIYSGATILGGNTVIGEGSTIGGNVWLVKSVPPYSKVYHTPAINVVKHKEEEEIENE